MQGRLFCLANRFRSMTFLDQIYQVLAALRQDGHSADYARLSVCKTLHMSDLRPLACSWLLQQRQSKGCEKAEIQTSNSHLHNAVRSPHLLQLRRRKFQTCYRHHFGALTFHRHGISLVKGSIALEMAGLDESAFAPDAATIRKLAEGFKASNGLKDKDLTTLEVSMPLNSRCRSF